MALITYPLNNIEYTAEDAELFHCTRKSGIWSEDSFKYTVTGADNLITIEEGIGWINNNKFSGKVVGLKSPETLDVGIADGTLPRIDVIALQFDTNSNQTELVVKNGVPSSRPILPEITQTATVYELYLASIYRAAGATVITAADVTDLRLDPTLCGLMADSVTHIDTEAINRQVQELLAILYKSISEIKAGTDVALKSAIYPIGSLHVTSTPENPGTYLGGTWELIDKHLKDAMYDSSAMSGLISGVNSNLTGARCVITTSGHNVTFFFGVEFGIDVGETDRDVFTVDYSKIGISRVPMTTPVMLTGDEANGIAFCLLHYSSGLFTLRDIVPKADKGTIVAGSTVQGQETFTLRQSYIDDAFCDKFFWKKTSLLDDTEQIDE